MNLFGLIGHPLGHSFSKAYFTAKFEREGLDCEYRNFDITSLGENSASGTSLRALAKQSMLSGFNVTIPYKEAILPYLDELDPAAAAIGAVNTVKVLHDGRLKGYNTDVVGFESLLEEIASDNRHREEGATLRHCEGGTTEAIQLDYFGSGWIASAKGLAMTQSDATAIPNSILLTPHSSLPTPHSPLLTPHSSLLTPHSALVLGTGGASKAVQYVLKKHRIAFHLVSRDPKKGDYTYDQLTPDIIKEHLLIINATPVGMAPNIDAAPDIPYEAISDKHALIDLIYNPVETLFLKNGREHGATTTNGLAMLHAQAEASWKIWNS